MHEKGLSILIPVFNCDIRNFVQSLHYQAVNTDFPFEILCYDDASTSNVKEFNKEVASLSYVRYKELKQNLGRSAIRNLLAKESSYSHLLFLDCDGKVIKSDFIKTYLSCIKSDVTIGGRKYTDTPPKNKDLYLHWLVGSKKEVIPAEIRSKNPYKSLMFNNVLIKKEVYLTIKLNEAIKGYGHEDSLFGYELEKRKLSVTHVNNPVQHFSLDSNIDFLNKSKEGIKNLVFLVSEKGLGKDTSLFKSYILLKKLYLLPLFSLVFKLSIKTIVKNLLSPKPRLSYFDLLKLFWFSKGMKSYPKSF